MIEAEWHACSGIKSKLACVQCEKDGLCSRPQSLIQSLHSMISYQSPAPPQNMTQPIFLFLITRPPLLEEVFEQLCSDP
jgi:hypothetical protein